MIKLISCWICRKERMINTSILPSFEDLPGKHDGFRINDDGLYDSKGTEEYYPASELYLCSIKCLNGAKYLAETGKYPEGYVPDLEAEKEIEDFFKSIESEQNK